MLKKIYTYLLCNFRTSVLSRKRSNVNRTYPSVTFKDLGLKAHVGTFVAIARSLIDLPAIE